MLTGQRIVITGATGFIGSHITRVFLEQGAQVYVLVRANSSKLHTLPSHESLHIITCPLERVMESVEMVQHADAFLHFAWGGVNRDEIDSPVVQAANIAASLDCVRVASVLGCRVFMDAGSRVEYGITKDGTMEEGMECHPVNEYGKAKLAFYEEAGKLCGTCGMTYYHLRFFSVYGVGDHPWSIISTLVDRLPKGETVALSACRHRWNFMEIEDAAQAVLSLYLYGERAAGTTFVVNIASRDTRELKSFVEEIHALCGGIGTLEYGMFEQAKEGALSICPAVEQLHSLTGGRWEERVTFEDGIRKMLECKEING